MNLFMRILLAIYAFCLAVISAIGMIVIARPEIFHSISSYITTAVLYNRGASIAAFVIVFVFFVLSLAFLFSGIRSGKDKKAVSKHTSIGEIRISLNSIENITLATARRLNGVKDTKARVHKLDDSVSITVNTVVMPDINIPALCEEIQTRVKKSVEECSGIAVNEVIVSVDNIYSGMTYKPRVE